MRTKNKRWLYNLFTGLIIMLAFSGLTFASEFSADVIMKGGPMPGNGKIWVKGQKMRQEMDEQGQKKIIIMDLDQGFHCVFSPDSEIFLKNKIKTKGKGFRPDNFLWLQQGLAEAQIELVGKETVKGYQCDKYLITFKNKGIGTMTQWFAIKLDYPIKTVNKSDTMGEVITELQNIKTGNVKDDLFLLPTGFIKLQQPLIPQPLIPQMPADNQ